MNAIRRAITAERKRLLTLSPTSILQEQHASSSSTTRSTLRTLNSKTRAPVVKSSAPSPSAPTSSSNDAVVKEPVTWAKPSEIPWQAKVVNSVNLIGRVKIPVQFETSSDGKNWAGTIISQDEGSESSTSPPSFWIPVIFEGDLARIAMCHLKEKDYVHVAGHLSVDVPPFKLSEVQANVQVMVHSINFVQGFPSSKKTSTPYTLDMLSTKNSDAAFKQENQGQLLDDAESAQVYKSTEVRSFTSAKKFDKKGPRASWRDLLTNSTEWDDNREKKHRGLVKAKYPDFKHKVTGDGLWLDTAPPEVLQGLGQLQFNGVPIKPVKEFDGVSYKPEKVGFNVDGDSWKHLIQNPGNWWDNRLNKGVRDPAVELMHTLVAVHAEVFAGCEPLLDKTLGILVEGLIDTLLNLFREHQDTDLKQLDANGYCQLMLELEYFETILNQYFTSDATESLKSLQGILLEKATEGSSEASDSPSQRRGSDDVDDKQQVTLSPDDLIALAQQCSSELLQAELERTRINTACFMESLPLEFAPESVKVAYASFRGSMDASSGVFVGAQAIVAAQRWR